MTETHYTKGQVPEIKTVNIAHFNLSKIGFLRSRVAMIGPASLPQRFRGEPSGTMRFPQGNQP
jgi:hypothetical protein